MPGPHNGDVCSGGSREAAALLGGLWLLLPLSLCSPRVLPIEARVSLHSPGRSGKAVVRVSERMLEMCLNPYHLCVAQIRTMVCVCNDKGSLVTSMFAGDRMVRIRVCAVMRELSSRPCSGGDVIAW